MATVEQLTQQLDQLIGRFGALKLREDDMRREAAALKQAIVALDRTITDAKEREAAAEAKVAAAAPVSEASPSPSPIPQQQLQLV